MITEKESLVNTELAYQLGLEKEEYIRIEGALGRVPNVVELAMFSVMWSEHCSYKSSKELLKLLPKRKRFPSKVGQVLVLAGEENAGVVDIGDGWAICFKMRSHNHPSAIEPFEGAATGVSRIIRDIFTMGAKPILMTNSLRVGELKNQKTQHLFRRMVKGIGTYGNCVGVPNVGGDAYFDDCYAKNPLVNVLCLGVARHEDIKHGVAKGVGNLIYYMGSATGRDGMGGAVFCSRGLTARSDEERYAVQKGDPFMEKILMEAYQEMLQTPGLVVGAQDLGAAGLTGALSEMAARGGMGVDVDLNKVPLRSDDMSSLEILLSETPERMLVVISPEREADLEIVLKKWDVTGACIGSVVEDGYIAVKHNGKNVACLPTVVLVNQAPVYERKASRPAVLDELQKWSASSIPDLDAKGITHALHSLLSHPTVADKRWIWRQFDHMVLASTVTVPGANAAVVRVRTGEGNEKFVAISNDGNNRFCALNPYIGGQIAVLECLRNIVCSGAKPIALTDNLNFGNPKKPESYYYLQECVKGIAHVCEFFDIPVIGGNVSLNNEHEGQAIDPTPVVAVAGLVDSVDAVIPKRVPRGDETLILLGDWPSEIGGSYYLKVVHNMNAGDAPAVDLGTEQQLHTLVYQLHAQGYIKAAQDISEGGLMVAILEMLFKKGHVGLNLNLQEATNVRRDALLFGESQSRIVIACNDDDIQKVSELAKAINFPHHVIGKVNDSGCVQINLANGTQLTWESYDLKRLWRVAIPSIMDEE